jgi:two-component system CitB family sensor kinase
MSLRLQLLLLQALIVCASVGGAGAVAGTLQERQLREAYLDRMIGVAQSVARLPTILDAFDDPDPSASIQPIAEVIRESSNVTYVVVTDAEGIRYSHPNADRIGERVSTDPSVPLSGEMFVGTETGTLGESWRAKVPVFADDGTVIGTVSVGILESALQEEFLGNLTGLLVALCLSAVAGLIGAAWVTSIIRRRIYRLEPREIASLVDSRHTMLHGMSEGVITVDKDGCITLANDAALELLGLDARGDEIVGRPAADVLEPAIIDVLERGEPEGQLVLAGERVLVARSTGTHGAPDGDGTVVPEEATLLLRDHTELHALLRQMDGAQSLADGLQAQAHEFANTLHVVAGLVELGHTDEALGYISRTGNGGPLADIGSESVLGHQELSALLMVKASHARELGATLEVVTSPVAPDHGVPSEWEGDLVTIVGNLVDNSIEACGAGHRTRVEFSVEEHDLVVRVDDDGPGIPAERAEQIFIDGMSTKTLAPDGQARGATRRGIGLALVRRIVRRRRGTVGLVPSALGGACFEVRLPLPAVTRDPGHPAATPVGRS